MQTTVTGKAYILGDNDQIIPAQYLTYNPAAPETLFCRDGGLAL